MNKPNQLKGPKHAFENNMEPLYLLDPHSTRGISCCDVGMKLWLEAILRSPPPTLDPGLLDLRQIVIMFHYELPTICRLLTFILPYNRSFPMRKVITSFGDDSLCKSDKKL